VVDQGGEVFDLALHRVGRGVGAVAAAAAVVGVDPELLGESLARLADRGLLRELPDPSLAAYHFAGLVMYKPMNQVMFAGTAARLAPDELEHMADRAAEVFLAAYGRP